MLECRHCGEYLRGEAEEKAARCPRCREPLYERTGGPEVKGKAPPPPGRELCAVHPDNLSVGVCKRCNNQICPVCRTRWHDEVLCLKCAELYMSSQDKNPEAREAHGRQAVVSIVCGVLAWVLVGVSMLPLFLSAGRTGRGNSLFLAALLIVVSVLPAVVGLAQATCAILVRGRKLPLATMGMIVSGTHIGLFLGVIILQLARS